MTLVSRSDCLSIGFGPYSLNKACGLDIHLMYSQGLHGCEDLDLRQRQEEQSGMVIEVENNQVVAHVGDYKYPLGNREDKEDLINHYSPNTEKTFSYEQDVIMSIPKTVQDIDDTSTKNTTTPSENTTARIRQSGSQRLWEFIRDLLDSSSYNPSHIKWVNRDKGEFKIVKTTDIAHMWGRIKNNDGMTYEKMSRAMRYYYKRKILAPVLNRRLVYKFGEKSYGWQKNV